MAEHHDVDVTLTIKRAPKVRRKHPVWDVLVIIFAAALIGVAAGDLIVVFAVVAGVAILLYVASQISEGRREQGTPS